MYLVFQDNELLVGFLIHFSDQDNAFYILKIQLSRKFYSVWKSLRDMRIMMMLVSPNLNDNS